MTQNAETAATPVDGFPGLYRTTLKAMDEDNNPTIKIELCTSTDAEDGPLAIELDLSDSDSDDMTFAFLTEAQAVQLHEALGNHIARLREHGGR